MVMGRARAEVISCAHQKGGLNAKDEVGRLPVQTVLIGVYADGVRPGAAYEFF